MHYAGLPCRNFDPKSKTPTPATRAVINKEQNNGIRKQVAMPINISTPANHTAYTALTVTGTHSHTHTQIRNNFASHYDCSHIHIRTELEMKLLKSNGYSAVQFLTSNSVELCQCTGNRT